MRGHLAHEAKTDMSDARKTPRVGTDTPTGTDPDAKYAQPGYEDKSFGQAVNQDTALADKLLDESKGDVGEAERRFKDEAAGAPVLDRQSDGHRSDDRHSDDA